MKYFQFKKLVRDEIVNNMKKNKQEPQGVRILEDKEYLVELKKKLKEEVDEFLVTSDEKEAKEELADVQEVVDYLKTVLKVKDSDFEKFKKEKLKKNGGFEKRIYLESVGIQEDSEWLEYFESHPEKYPLIE